jgi:hypothetical protein
LKPEYRQFKNFPKERKNIEISCLKSFSLGWRPLLEPERPLYVRRKTNMTGFEEKNYNANLKKFGHKKIFV